MACTSSDFKNDITTQPISNACGEQCVFVLPAWACVPCCLFVRVSWGQAKLSLHMLQIGLTGFKCRCGYVFCGSHRLAEAHACDFDYKTAGRDNLAKANPLIQVLHGHSFRAAHTA